MTLQGPELIISLITLILAYGIAATIAGSFKAWVANFFGDDTAKSLGFQSLNPLVHADFFGFLILIYIGFGWREHIPINPDNIQGRFRFLKIIFVYFSGGIMNFIMAVGVLAALVYKFGFSVLRLAKSMIYCGELPQHDFINAYPASSSLVVSLGMIGITFLFLNVLLVLLDFIFGAFNIFALKFLEGSSFYDNYRVALRLFFILCIFYFFGNSLHSFIVKFLLTIGWLFATLFGGM